jgi:hypothetical protein
MRGVLARHQRDVGGGAGQLLALCLPELREQCDVGDLLGRDHGHPDSTDVARCQP